MLASLLARVSGRPYVELLRDELTAAVGEHNIVLATAPPELAAYGAAGALMGTALELLAFDRALMDQRWLLPEHPVKCGQEAPLLRCTGRVVFSGVNQWLQRAYRTG